MSLSNIPVPSATALTITHHAGHSASSAAGNAWVGRFMRFGYVARGTLYVAIGVLALRLALGTSGEAMTQTGAIAMIGHQPFGRALLVAISVGLAGYSLWGAIRAVVDPLHQGHSLRGLTKRVGFAGSALAYASLLIITLRFISGPHARTATSYDLTEQLLAKPFGAWLVGIIGLCWTAIACIKIVHGWRGSFERDLELARRGPAERRWAMGLGRVGSVTRAIVFTIIGIFIVASALHANPHRATGLDGALLGLARQPFGRTLLAAAGLGLISFGAFSVMCARWMRLHVAGPGPS